jgi:hypothetical protein
MKILITENKRDMLFKAEFKDLFNKLTPTRAGRTENINYIYFDEVYNDDAVTGLSYRPNTRQLVIYPNYFMSLRMFMSSEKEFNEMIAKCYEELTDKPVSFVKNIDEYNL